MTENLLEEPQNLLEDQGEYRNNRFGIPDKFIDPETEEINVNLLLKSYLELERKLSNMIGMPNENNPEEVSAFRKALGVPETPDGYQIEARHKLLESDEEVNRKLYDAGFTPKQAQLVYDLAAERVIPVIEDLTSEFEADRQRQRLIEYFGGEERWAEISRQLSAWGEKNLSEDIYRTLATTYEGVIAISRMMEGGEPNIGRRSLSQATELSQDELRSMMQDPRYWRDKDPSYIAKISEGFKKLYP